MKSHEIIDEWSTTAPDIKKALTKKGYKFLGSGVDQSAYLEPGTGYVLKVFGTQPGLHGKLDRFSKDHKMFFKWAAFCMANADNKFLPKFFGYESFVWHNHNYLQIRQEPLTESNQAGRIVECLTYYCYGKTATQVLKDLERGRVVFRYKDLFPFLSAMMDIEDVKLLVKTTISLQKLCDSHGWSWDLHNENIMMRGTTPVLVDPMVA